MKVIAAYLLAQLGGNSNPSANDLKKILNSVGAEIDDVKIELLLSQVEGKDINELIATGKQRLASTTCMSFGFIDVVEEKKEEKKVEKVEESDEEDFNFSLFD
ncbi:60S acidic ribosomal protein P2-like isoform X2 [Solanum stenotomum]|uniref:60S acidic ribosomal protein P2-like isoform X2 n=1 Tax=Solanum stenotomum TaxID=172797 RepID=UPI0020D1E0D6|nr:60S acidic ribosomal protein P2-like isoform X2 [Solanum stenotomum]